MKNVSTRIILGAELPEDWQLNLILQKDKDFQLLLKEWRKATDLKIKEELHQKLKAYREKVRKVNNLPKPES